MDIRTRPVDSLGNRMVFYHAIFGPETTHDLRISTCTRGGNEQGFPMRAASTRSRDDHGSATAPEVATLSFQSMAGVPFRFRWPAMK